MVDFKDDLVNRFLRYVKVPSQSVVGKKEVPSTKGQFDLAYMLKDELIALGLSDVKVNEHAIVTATLNSNIKNNTTVGFVCHLDTVDVSLSDVVKPQIINYKGGDVLLNKEKDIKIKVSEHPELNDYINEDIIFTDGTSVLGADNKAAIANVMTALDIIIKENLEHCNIKIAFVPDEEIGLCGSKLLDLKEFNVDFAYTIDCCKKGELVYETFNAGSLTINIKGVSAHPMSAKGVLVNPLLVAHDFISMFDRNETPECTDKKDGYWWFVGITSDPLYCTLKLHIRDFDKEHYNYRVQYVKDCIEKLKTMHPRAEISLDVEHVYENIANNVTKEDRPIALLFKAFEKEGIDPNVIAMRGGTDGSVLSAKGVVTPNYFTGGHNFHSYAEFLPINAFCDATKLTLRLIDIISHS